MFAATVFITYQATLGCVPATVPARTARNTCQPPASMTVPTPRDC